MSACVHPDFWRGKRVLVTGHTGFKGGWLTVCLRRLGSVVYGFGLPPTSRPNLFTLLRLEDSCETALGDIRDQSRVIEVVDSAKPDIVFHLAAQSLVRLSYREPSATFATNVMGTIHLLEALRQSESARVAVMITTDKVYRNADDGRPFTETDPLGGHDPYSASKAASEIVIESFRRSFLRERGVAVGSARAGNVIGGGDWSADRIVPDAMRAWLADAPLIVRRPDAVRPWQHILEPLTGYLALAERLWHDPSLAAAYNFAPSVEAAAPVRHVVELARSALGRGEIRYAEAPSGPHESPYLALDGSLAARILGVRPHWDLETAVTRTVEWYCRQSRGDPATLLCHADIDAYGMVP